MKKAIALTGAFLLGLGFAAAGGGNGILIRLPAQVTVVGPSLNLGDVAEVIGQNQAVVDKVRRVTMGRAAPAGQTLKVTLQLVRIVLRRDGYSLDQFSFEGPESSDVLTSSQEISKEELLPQVKEYILGALKESPGNVQVKLGGPEKKMLIPAGEVKVNIRPPLNGRYEGTVFLTTELEVNGHLARVFPMRVDVQVQHMVVIAKKRIEKGELLGEENVGLARIPTSKIPLDALRRLDIVLGRTAAFPILPGTPMRISFLYDPPVIRRGKLVEAIVRKGNVEISVQVRAVEEGKAGDVIRVENTETHKALRAKIQDERTVVIEDAKP